MTKRPPTNDAPDGGRSKRIRSVIVYAVMGLALVFWLERGAAGVFRSETIAYTDFKQLVANGNVTEIRVGPDVIDGRRKEGGREFRAFRVDDPKLLDDAQRAGVKVTGEPSRGLTSTLLSFALPLGLLLLLWGPSLRRLGQGPQGVLSVGQSKARIYAEKDITVRFDDVAGVDEAKAELAEVVQFLREPDRFSRLGAHIPKGILVVGPPGTGKTLLARAVAGEAAVPFFSISGSEFVEMFVGVGAARVRDLFEKAAQKAPCIIFIDELDALGKVRGVGPVTNDEREQTLNQLLAELDGFNPRAGVILMAATNRPEILDPALLRPGRFDRQVLVDRPDKGGRLAILKLHGRKIVLDEGVDLEAIASLTAGFVGADLANLVNEAALLGVRRNKDKVGRAELEEAVERVVAGLERKSRVLTAPEKERVAHHECGHALMALAIPGADPVRKISIIPRGISALGYTMQAPVENRFLMTRQELLDKIAVLLGGRVAEEQCFGDVSTGAEDDLAKATAVARAMIKSYGMSKDLAPRSFESERRALFLPGAREEVRGDYSEATAQAIDAEVAAIISGEHRRAQLLLRAYDEALRAAARALLQGETMSGEELAAIVAAHPVAQRLAQTA